MRIGVDLLLWTGCYTRKDVKLVDKVARMGFDGVEFPIFDAEAVPILATRKALDAHGLGATVCTVIAKGSLVSPSAQQRRAAIDYMYAVLEVGKAIGADCVAGPIHSPIGFLTGKAPTQTEWKHAVASLRKVADRAEQLDIDVGIEPLNRFETYFLNICKDATRLCRNIDSQNVGVLYDTFHTNIEEKDPIAALRGIGQRRLKHVHASENDRGIPGTGHVLWNDVFATLRDMNYNRWVTIESFDAGIKDLASTVSIWRPLAKDGDDLARRGLAFLRRYVKA